MHNYTKKIDSINENGWFENINVNGLSIKFKIDTSAQVNILPVEVIRQLNSMSKMEKKAFEEPQTASLGSVNISKYISCDYRNINNKWQFIIKWDHTNNKIINPILGLDGCLAFKLIKIN